MKDLLLVTPPFTQLNTPYPATAYIKGFLNTKQITSFQSDLGIEVILKLFNRGTFQHLFEKAYEEQSIVSENCQRIYQLREQYLQTLDQVLLFLQGKNHTLARQLCTDNFLPRASRFQQLDDLEWAFGNMGMQDKAKHLATLYLEDLSDFLVECVDPNFGFSRYAEKLGRSANSFDELYEHLNAEPTFIDDMTLSILEQRLIQHEPKLVCFSVPFPGNLYSAFRCAQFIKRNFPDIKIAMGGGFPNTELRSVTDVRVFEFVDFISLDDGELPLELIYGFVINRVGELKRTFILENDAIVYRNDSTRSDYKLQDVGTPDYTDLLLDQYISVIEIANPMHSLWSDGRWNKLTMAHGCYWGKCTFCDISLDYIQVYEPVAASLLVDRIETIIAQTGETGFHFVDEAAPPSLMKALAMEILKRKLTITWWTNIRFEKNFTQDLCFLLKASGCIAVSGGLEVASDRLLQLIDKGVTVAQVAQVTRNFTEANIMVHSYLMYGYPTQTVQETVDSLEMVRQLFELGIVQSGFWHQFALTAHSPVGLRPKDFGVVPDLKKITFANNDIDFVDGTGIDHAQFSFGLKKSLFNFMHGIGFDMPLQEWFDVELPVTTIQPDFIYNCLQEDTVFKTRPTARIVWLGSSPICTQTVKSKKGKTWEMLTLKFHTKTNVFEITVDRVHGHWLYDLLNRITPQHPAMTFKQVQADFELQSSDFELFWYSKPIRKLFAQGLLVV
ncbi:Radical SAM superfamily enzyme YgiQ, UPF0313 family [Maribacter sedimenticola]|uniref:Radical SAM superfamily enzyme YgiQ, UPF0313 family n=1 Tax=Maribacter sedimenticola TaxID=228956 RepID=A0ABY1SKV1_9FLAO|nr:radical SAM protein [Maribacter sedimenticola]SNR70434.1 Radical SAM superfamily enzyme YgiQ, UPF0313 family [Maribacter sedimenticola]